MTPSELERHVGAALRCAGKRHIICISGGADSTALLLAALQAFDLQLYAAHCDFHLRGEESERDRVFVENLCNRLGVKLFVKHFDVNDYQRQQKCSVEMACRDLRYQWFDELRSELQADRIVVAHNADDNIETLFLNLFRGTGLAGLVGMKEDTGRLLRPLLPVTRKQIEEYLQEKGEEYITDSTNLESDYKRNYIRNELLPVILKRWPAAKQAIIRCQQNLADINLALISDSETISGDALLWKDLGKALSPTRLIMDFASGKGFNTSQAREMARCYGERKSGCVWKSDLGEIVSDPHGLNFVDTTKPLSPPIPIVEEYTVDEELFKRIKAAPLTEAWFTAGMENYEWRLPRTGDRMSPLGMKGSRLVSDILREAGVNASQRPRTWMLCSRLSGEILWIPSIKRSRHHLLTPASPLALRLSLLPNPQ